MPCIQTKVNVKISEEKEEVIKSKLGKAIELIPGKSESWLMVSFEDECKLYFKGSKDDKIAFVEVKIFGKASDKAYDDLTAAITDILHEELDISPLNIYVKYEEVDHWGWNGSNF
ncbi:phenylpyruvate tautomerase MIF-related protein [Clostridium oryzae]|uniref:L-dopachrome isomerase n=1 Tax=Clostridium oryzae TaxID=1450648 RepID=A0A1V4IZ21_9CLOT|nr:phenylpyruvate tautomerase MIF-related protein [Clostridium oryzae]OPJ64647.1 macrophage migration inhibitory factor [Clostridium oryzae]